MITRLKLVGMILAVGVALVGAWTSPAQAEVVFGNLGVSGTNALGTTSTDIESGSWIAQGFNTGTSTFLSLESVTLGLFGTDAGTIPLTVGIWSGATPTTLEVTSSPTSVGDIGRYAFSFPSFTLLPSTTYWVVANGGSWYFNTGSPAAPQGQNASGYTYVDTLESSAIGASPAGPWTDEGTPVRYSVSVVSAVPEPSALSLGLASLGCVALAGWARSRKRKVSLDA